MNFGSARRLQHGRGDESEAGYRLSREDAARCRRHECGGSGARSSRELQEGHELQEVTPAARRYFTRGCAGSKRRGIGG